MVFPQFKIESLVRKGLQLRAVKGSLLLTITKLPVGVGFVKKKPYNKTFFE